MIEYACRLHLAVRQYCGQTLVIREKFSKPLVSKRSVFYMGVFDMNVHKTFSTKIVSQKFVFTQSYQLKRLSASMETFIKSLDILRNVSNLRTCASIQINPPKLRRIAHKCWQIIYLKINSKKENGSGNTKIQSEKQTQDAQT